MSCKLRAPGLCWGNKAIDWSTLHCCCTPFNDVLWGSKFAYCDWISIFFEGAAWCGEQDWKDRNETRTLNERRQMAATLRGILREGLLSYEFCFTGFQENDFFQYKRWTYSLKPPQGIDYIKTKATKTIKSASVREHCCSCSLITKGLSTVYFNQADIQCPAAVNTH